MTVISYTLAIKSSFTRLFKTTQEFIHPRNNFIKSEDRFPCQLNNLSDYDANCKIIKDFQSWVAIACDLLAFVWETMK